MIALGIHFQKSQEGFSSNLMASSTALQLDKSSLPSQILLVYRLGKASTTPETQTLPALNHTPPPSVADIWLKMPTSIIIVARALGIKQLGRQEGVFDNISEVVNNVWL